MGVKLFHLPDLGEGVHEGQIVHVLVREGETVRLDQPLMEVETDKASVEIPSPFAGTVEKIHVAAGQVVNVGDLMVTMRESAAAAPGSRSLEGGGKGMGGPSGSATRGSPQSTPAASLRSTHPPAPSLPPVGRGSTSNPTRASTAHTRHTPASPAVRALARQLGVELESITGSGPGGRITRADVDAAAAGGSPVPSGEGSGAGAPRAADDRLQPSAPRARPSIQHSPEEGGGRSAAAQLTPMTPGRDSWGTTRREPLTRIRRAIADAMARSASTIPQVTDTDDADVTELDRLRQGYHSDEKPGRKLTLLPFAVRAVVLALKKHPILNASLDADAGAIVFHDYISIAVGVQTDRGLVAPVIRAAGDLSVVQITDELAMLAAKARAASFEVNDTRGGTFTISNAGAMGGSRYSTPIINPPQAAILALGRARWMPRVVGGPGGMIAPRLILPLSLSFDHRIIDGGVSVPFMQEIIAALEHPARLML